MKKLLYYSIIASACFAVNNKTFAQNANTSLSNLISPTKVNVNLLPDNDSKRNLGSAAKGWKNLYLDSAVYLYGAKFLAAPGGNKLNTAVGFKTLSLNTSGNANTASGYFALYSNTSGYSNTANGYAALTDNQTGAQNTASGVYALSGNTTGNNNTANGHSALYRNTTGYDNTAIGQAALSSNTTGYYNTAIGYSALFSGKTNVENTAIGYSSLSSNNGGFANTATGSYAMYSNTSGDFNTANGVEALYHNIDGGGNTANGYGALASNIGGGGNTAVGEESLALTTTAAGNTAVGSYAGSDFDNGFYNVFVGANTDVNGAGYYNVIAIGQGTICTDVSQVTIGNGATATYRTYADWSNISDGRFKKNIKQNVPGLVFINKLQPITYTLDATGIDNFLHQSQSQDKQASGQAKVRMSKALAAKEKTIFTGFVAQDVEKAAKSLNYDFSGVDAAKNNKDLYGLRYAEFVVPLVKGMQELSKMNDEKDAKINDLETRLVKLEAMMNVSQSTTHSKLQTTNISSVSLGQNIPNPFQNSTAINYSLPNQFTSAQIIVTDKSGKVLKQIAVSGNGKGSVQVNTSTLSSGAYQYSLHVDGRIIDTKQMIITK